MRSLLRNRWVRRLVLPPLVLLVALAAAGFIAFHVSRATGGATRDKVVAELDATDPNWRAADLTAARNAKLPPAEENAAEVACRAYALMPAEHAYRDTSPPVCNAEWKTDLKLPHLPQPTDVEDTRNRLEPAKEAVEVARGVRHVRGGGISWTFNKVLPICTLLPRHQSLRMVMTLLDDDALLLAHDGQGDESLDSCHAILAVARGLGDDPVMIGQLIRIKGAAAAVNAAERTLAWCDTFDDAKLAELGKAFEAEATATRLPHALRGERASVYQTLESVGSGTIGRHHLVPFDLMQPDDPVTAQVIRARVPDEQAVGLRVFTALIAAAEQPPGPYRTRAIDAIQNDCLRLIRQGSGYPLLRLLFFSFDKAVESDTRTVALLRTAVVALACERHRLKTGSFPAALADLPKELLAEVPSDPYTGKPILFKPTADGLVVYCTGADGSDDGGNLSSESKPGFDLGVRLFHPEHRRQPPVEKP